MYKIVQSKRLLVITTSQKSGCQIIRIFSEFTIQIWTRFEGIHLDRLIFHNKEGEDKFTRSKCKTVPGDLTVFDKTTTNLTIKPALKPNQHGKPFRCKIFILADFNFIEGFENLNFLQCSTHTMKPLLLSQGKFQPEERNPNHTKCYWSCHHCTYQEISSKW